MKKSLVIVESPSKAKTVNKYLGDKFKVIASVGHVKNLPKSKIGIDFENDYAPTYETIPGKEKIIKELKENSKNAEEIYIATDPDREGEAIAYDIAQEIKRSNLKIHRVLFNEITKKGIDEGINSPMDIDYKLVSSQQARRVMDRIVGYKISPFLWKVVYYGLSAGRVQSVALRLICEREKEIKNFISTEYWSIIADFKDREKNKVFQAKLIEMNDTVFKFNGESPRICNQKEADNIIDDLKNYLFKVADISKKEVKRNPYPPYTTSSLQQDASIRLRMPPKKTMMLAQKLYEGIDLKAEGLVGLITYMRTDSTRLSEDAISECRHFINDKFGKEFLPSHSRHYSKKSKTTQDAHEAIRPTSVMRSPEKVKKYLTDDLYKLYDLIWKRFVACQMCNSVSNQITLLLESLSEKKDYRNHYKFRTTASNLLFPGFLSVYNDYKENGDDPEEEFPIPEDIEIGDHIDLQNLKGNQHFTNPPPRYTESSLIKQLDSLGIGRPSTYAMIVSTIINRTYIELNDRKLYATELGITINNILVKYFPDIFNVKFTAELELELDKIATGELEYKHVLDNFYNPFNTDLVKLNFVTKEIKESLQEKTDIKCENCGSIMTIKWGRNGRFLSCSNYPKCKNAQPLPGEQQEHDDIAEGKFCDLCGAQMIVKSSRFGKFFGCSNYPKCKNIMPITLGIKCPKCNKGEILERKTQKSRKKFFGCSNYPDCDFISNFKPVIQKCPSCSSNFMVEKTTKKLGKHLECIVCKHKEVFHAEAEVIEN